MAIAQGPENFQAMIAARLLFPFALLSALWADSFWNVPVFALFFQFPIYALVLVVCGLRGQSRRGLAMVGLAHVTAAILFLLLV